MGHQLTLLLFDDGTRMVAFDGEVMLEADDAECWPGPHRTVNLMAAALSRQTGTHVTSVSRQVSNDELRFLGLNPEDLITHDIDKVLHYDPETGITLTKA